jgi:hypothetical protein
MQTFKGVLYEIGCGIFPAPEIEIDFEQYVHIEDQALKKVTDRNSFDILNYLDKWALKIKEPSEDKRN